MGMKISDFSNHFNNLVEATIYNSLPSGLNIENLQFLFKLIAVM